MSPSEEVAELRTRINNMRLKTEFLKRRFPTTYEEFLVALESAEFYLGIFAVEEANAELSRAIAMFEKKI